MQIVPPTPGEPQAGAGGWSETILTAVALGLAAGAVYVLPALLGRPLVETPEARVAVAAREMLESGEWVLPTLGGEVRLNKPPWAYWQTAAAAELLKGNGPLDETVMARAVLLPSALAAALTVIVLVIMASMAWGRGTGAIAGFCFGVSWMVIQYSQLGYLDCTLMAACAVSLCGAGWVATAPRPGVFSAAVFGIGLGLGLLVKGPLALAMVLPALLICCFWERSLIMRRLLLILLGLILAALIAVPWFVMVANRLPAGMSVWEFLNREMASGHEQNDRYVYYLYKLAGGFAPWTLVVFLALLAILPRGIRGIPAWIDRRLTGVRFCESAPAPFALLRFFFIATLAGLLILYASAKQQEHYLLPLLPPLALVASCLLGALRKPGGRREERMAWMQLAVGLAIGVAAATSPAWCIYCERIGVGFGFSIPAGVGLALLHFYLARQWVEGRPTHAVGILALTVWSIGVAYSVLSTWNTQRTSTLAGEAALVREQLDAVGPDARVYGVGYPVPLMVFYFRRPVCGLDELKDEPSDAGVQRVIVARRRDILDPANPIFSKLGLAPSIRPGASKLAVVRLPQDQDWPRKAAEALSRPE